VEIFHHPNDLFLSASLWNVKMLAKEVEWCSIDNWYSQFKKVTFKTVILPIPNEVLTYLKSDGSIILPKECENDEPADPDFDEEEEDNESEAPSFPEFNQQIKDAIESLGGQVFPKLNWSAPRDAAWIGIGHSLKCESLSQIWLLLKSSEFIVHDLTQPYKDCSDEEAHQSNEKNVLALKKWSRNINPATEFRCFIRKGSLIALEQRDTSNFYKHICDEKEDIIRDIRSFFNEHVQEKIHQVQNVVMDVTRPSKDVVKLIDFNPFGETTDISLFEWSELREKEFDEAEVDFRYVQNSTGILPTGLRMFSLPKDIVDLACGTDPDKLVDFLKLQENIQKKENE